MKFIARFAFDLKGATAVEYGILGGLLAVAIIGGVGMIGGGLEDVLTTVAERIAPK